jgi:hypothetical protein
MNSVSSPFIFEVRDERARVRNLVRRLLDPADLGPPPAAGAAPTIHQSTMTEAGQPLPAATEAGPSRLAPRAPEEEGRAAKRRRFSTDRPAVVKSAAANRAKVTSPMRKTEDTVEEDMAEEDEDITSQPEPPVKKKAASKNKIKIKEERKRTASRGVLVETSADENEAKTKAESKVHQSPGVKKKSRAKIDSLEKAAPREKAVSREKTASLEKTVSVKMDRSVPASASSGTSSSKRRKVKKVKAKGEVKVQSYVINHGEDSQEHDAEDAVKEEDAATEGGPLKLKLKYWR